MLAAGAPREAALMAAVLGDPRGAIEQLTAAIASRPDAKGYGRRAHARYVTGDLEGAEEDLDAAVKLDPTEPSARALRGLVRARQNRKAEAVVDWSAAIESKPDLASALVDCGWARFHLGDPAGALADLNRAVDLEPQDSGARSDVLLRRASVRMRLKQWDAALADADRAGQAAPQALAVRGMCKIQLGDHAGGRTDCEQALNHGPIPEAHYAMALVEASAAGKVWFGKHKRKGRAIKHLREAVTHSPLDWPGLSRMS